MLTSAPGFCKSTIYHIDLSPNELNPRVCEGSGNLRPISYNNMTKFCDVGLALVEGIIHDLGINFIINIVKSQVGHPLKSMK